MVKTTKAQRRALKRVFDRGPLLYPKLGSCVPPRQMTYREWRRTVEPDFMGSSAYIAVRWRGILITVQPNGCTQHGTP